MIIKTDDPRYNRDPFSNAIIRTDQKALMKHRQKLQQVTSIKNSENEINNLRSEVNDIKETVNKILQLLKDKDGNI